MEAQEDFNFRIETLYLFVLLNLLKNAFYYLKIDPDSGIWLRLGGGSNNRLRCKDTSSGIAADKLVQLFNSFFTPGKRDGTRLRLVY